MFESLRYHYAGETWYISVLESALSDNFMPSTVLERKIQGLFARTGWIDSVLNHRVLSCIGDLMEDKAMEADWHRNLYGPSPSLRRIFEKATLKEGAPTV